MSKNKKEEETPAEKIPEWVIVPPAPETEIVSIVYVQPDFGPFYSNTKRRRKRKGE